MNSHCVSTRFLDPQLLNGGDLMKIANSLLIPDSVYMHNHHQSERSVNVVITDTTNLMDNELESTVQRHTTQ